MKTLEKIMLAIMILALIFSFTMAAFDTYYKITLKDKAKEICTTKGYDDFEISGVLNKVKIKCLSSEIIELGKQNEKESCLDRLGDFCHEEHPGDYNECKEDYYFDYCSLRECLYNYGVIPEDGLSDNKIYTQQKKNILEHAPDAGVCFKKMDANKQLEIQRCGNCLNIGDDENGDPTFSDACFKENCIKKEEDDWKIKYDNCANDEWCFKACASLDYVPERDGKPWEKT